MRKRGLTAAGLLVALAALSLANGSGRGTASPATKAALERAYASLPLAFEPNRGQADGRTAFLARGAGYSIALRSTGALFALGKRDHLSMELRGAKRRAALLPEQPLPGRVNYLLGNEHSKWLTGIPTYARLRAQDVYPGIDLAYYGKQGRFEYDLLVQPGVSPEAISLSFAGARQITLERNGNLAFQLAGGALRQLAPRIYQQVGGEHRRVHGRFVLNGNRVGFAVGRYDRTRTLVIDPGLAYSTFLGGSLGDYDFGVAVDSSASAYVTGYAESADFPTLNAFDTTVGGAYDGFVTKLTANGALAYSTYLGGSGFDYGYGIAVDSSGSAYVTGYTQSVDFPRLNAFDSTLDGGLDAFVTKLDADGALAYSTYLGGSTSDYGNGGIVVDPSGSAYVSGYTNSSDFPTLNPSDSTLGGPADAFVTKFDATGALAYSTYLGGSLIDFAYGTALDSSGSAYITGRTFSADFPTLNAFDSTLGGDRDAFVTKLDPLGALAYSTYLGGSSLDYGYGIAVDTGGSAYATGYTQSANFPTLNAFDSTLGGSADAFVTRLAPTGALGYSTYLGGSLDDYGDGIAVDSSGAAYLTGYTHSTNFPTASPLQATNGGMMDAFVSKLDAAGNALASSTYLGGSADDYGFGIAVDSSSSTYVTGQTFSANFPTLNAFDSTLGGGQDAFVTKVSGPPTAVSITSFRVSHSGDEVIVRWRTGSETGLLGFNLYRGQSRLNLALIHVAAGSRGSSYSFRDRLPRASGSPRYWLEEVRLDGSRRWHGPISPPTGP